MEVSAVGSQDFLFPFTRAVNEDGVSPARRDLLSPFSPEHAARREQGCPLPFHAGGVFSGGPDAYTILGRPV